MNRLLSTVNLYPSSFEVGGAGHAHSARPLITGILHTYISNTSYIDPNLILQISIYTNNKLHIYASLTWE